MRLTGFLLVILSTVMNVTMAKEVVLPVKLTKDTLVPIVKLNINGKSQRFMFDSGSQTALHLPLDTLQQLPQTEKQEGDDLSTDLSGNIISASKYLLQHVYINSIDFENIQAVELKPWGFEYSSDPSKKLPPARDDDLPVVGLALFKNHTITLDFAHKKIIVDDDNDFDGTDKGWMMLPYRYHPQEGLIITVTDQSKQYNLVLDTGATMSIIASRSLPEKYNNGNNSAMTDSDSSTLRQDKNGDLQILNVYLANPSMSNQSIQVAIMDNMPKEFESDGLLGINFLKKYKVKIDQKNQKLWIKPAN